MSIKRMGGIPFEINTQGAVGGALIAASLFIGRIAVFDAANPFIMAYISGYAFKGKAFYISAVMAAFGILSAYRAEFSIRYLLAIVFLAMLNVIVSVKHNESIIQPCAAAASFFVAAMAIVLVRGAGAFYIGVAVLETALIFAMGLVLSRGRGCIEGVKKRGALSHDELLCMAAVLGIISIGLADIMVFTIPLRYIFAIIIVLMSAEASSSVGAAAGIFMGFLLHITGFVYIYFAVLLAMAAFAAGQFKERPKWAAFIAFAMSAAVLALFFDLTLFTPGNGAALVIAGLVYSFTPKNIMANIPFAISPAIKGSGGYAERVRRITMERIGRVNMAYKNLAELFMEYMPQREFEKNQFFGTSQVLTRLSTDIGHSLKFYSHIENAIIEEFRKTKTEVMNVIVLQNLKGRYEISLSQKPKKFDKKQAKAMGAVLSRHIGRKMELAEEYIDYGTDSLVSLEYLEVKPFYIYTGLARRPKDEGKETGDSFTTVQLRDGRCILALSDGMGSGDKAKEQSRAAIELLEGLLEGNFTKESALDLINAVLLLKSGRGGKELFSTLDICLTDLYQGRAEFIKIGACPSFVCRDNEVLLISAKTLPVGILDTVDMETQTIDLRHGDIIVMMTDGAIEPLPDGFMEEALTSIRLKNPQDIADELMEVIKPYSDKHRDDITILVAKVYDRS